MGEKLFGGGKPDTSRLDALEAERKAAEEERKRLEEEQKQERLRRSTGQRGIKQLFSGGETGFKTTLGS